MTRVKQNAIGADIKRQFATTQDAIDARGIKVGDVIQIAERADATFEAKTGLTPNGYNIIAGQGAINFVLRESSKIYLAQWGLDNSNSAAVNTSILQAFADYASLNRVEGVLPKQNGIAFNGPITFTSPSFDWTYQLAGYGLKFTELVNQSTGGEHGFVLTGSSGTESVWSEFKRFLITGNASSGDGFHVEFAGRVEFDRVECSDHGGSGFHYENSWSPSFIRCRGDRNGEYGVFCLGGVNNDTNGAYVEGGAYSSNTLDGIYIEAASDDDTLSGEIFNVGLSNNLRNGIWIKTPGLTVMGCFPEFNQGAQIKIGDSADARVIVGVVISQSYFDARNLSGPDHQGVVIEEARGVSIDACNFKNVISCVEIDAASTNITIGTTALNRRTTATTTNIADINSTLVTDATKPLHIRQEVVQVGIGSINKYQVESGTTGYRFDIEGNGATASSSLARILKDGAVLAGMRNDGRLILDGAISTAGSPTTIQNKIEIFDAAGASLGWVPIYANF